MLYLIQAVHDNRIQLPYTTHILFSNHEEVGYGGNSNIPDEVVEYLAVDMGAIGDGLTADEFSVSSALWTHQVHTTTIYGGV